MRGDGEALLEGFPGEGQQIARGGRVRGEVVAPETRGPGAREGSSLAWRRERR